MDPLTYQRMFIELKDTCQDYIPTYTDRSKDNGRVAAAAVTRGPALNAQVRLKSRTSIFTAELQAILYALDFIDTHNGSDFIIL